MDNLPGNPSDQNNNNSVSPPPFGSNFNPSPNPAPQPSTSPLPSTYSEVAQHKLRDSHGRFASDHISQTSLASQTTPTSSFGDKLKTLAKFLIKIKWGKLTLYVTGATTFIYLVISNPAVQNLVNHLFPNSSPILARAISLQGVLKTSESGIYSLVLPDQQTYILHFKPSSSLTNLKKLDEVVVKGNLAWTPYVIENAEVYPLNITTP